MNEIYSKLLHSYYVLKFSELNIFLFGEHIQKIDIPLIKGQTGYKTIRKVHSLAVTSIVIIKFNLYLRARFFKNIQRLKEETNNG